MAGRLFVHYLIAALKRYSVIVGSKNLIIGIILNFYAKLNKRTVFNVEKYTPVYNFDTYLRKPNYKLNILLFIYKLFWYPQVKVKLKGCNISKEIKVTIFVILTKCVPRGIKLSD